MASFSHFWVLTLFLLTVLRNSQLACSYGGGGRAADGVSSSSSASRKLLDHPTFIGKKSLVAIGEWCVPREGIPAPQLQSNLDYACSHGANCLAITPGHNCFLPNTLQSHATFAMNDYFQSHGRTLEACSFGGTGMLTNKDPSYDHCFYPGL